MAKKRMGGAACYRKKGGTDMLSRLRNASPAVVFVVLMGIVSLFADMTHEGARSIYGAYLPLLGASATALGFATGFGECIGYALRLATGIIADKTKHYWGMTMLGYGVNMVAIPFLALVPENGWFWACLLIILERTGKAIRQPAKNTLLSFAATRVGVGKAFAVQEFLDQIGAFLGPVFLFGILWFKSDAEPRTAYALCFAALGIPALLTMAWLFLARRHFPDPGHFEEAGARQNSGANRSGFLLYIFGIMFFALGFVDFPLITLHVSRQNVKGDALPLLYALAMLADAFAALLFGWLYDRFRFKTLIFSGLMAAFFPIFVFCSASLGSILVGVALWGIGMGAQESILKAAVVTLTSKEKRSTNFGIFESCFGLSWFLGSWLMGWLYDMQPAYLAAFSVAAQLCALPLYLGVSMKNRP